MSDGLSLKIKEELRQCQNQQDLIQKITVEKHLILAKKDTFLKKSTEKKSPFSIQSLF